MLKSVVLLFPLAVSLILAQSSKSEGWEHVQSEDGLEMYLKTDSSGSVSVRAEISLQADFDDVIPYLEHPVNFPHWLAEVSDAEIVDHLNAQSEIVSFTFDPASSAIRYTITASYTASNRCEKGRYVAKLQGIAPDAPLKAGFQQPEVFQGYLGLSQAQHQPLKLLIYLTVNLGNNMSQEQLRQELREFATNSADNLRIILASNPPIRIVNK